MVKRGVNHVRKKEDGGLNWDSMMYDVLGVEFPICYQCLKEMKEKGEVMK